MADSDTKIELTSTPGFQQAVDEAVNDAVNAAVETAVSNALAGLQNAHGALANGANGRNGFRDATPIAVADAIAAGPASNDQLLAETGDEQVGLQARPPPPNVPFSMPATSLVNAWQIRNATAAWNDTTKKVAATTWQFCLPGCNGTHTPSNVAFCWQNNIAVYVDATQYAIFSVGPWFDMTYVTGSESTPLTQVWALARNASPTRPDWAVRPDANTLIQFYDQTQITTALATADGAKAAAAGLCWLLAYVDGTDVTVVNQVAVGGRLVQGVVGDADVTPSGGTGKGASIDTLSPGQLEIHNWLASPPLTNDPKVPMLIRDTSNVAQLMQQPQGALGDSDIAVPTQESIHTRASDNPTTLEIKNFSATAVDEATGDALVGRTTLGGIQVVKMIAKVRAAANADYATDAGHSGYSDSTLAGHYWVCGDPGNEETVVGGTGVVTPTGLNSLYGDHIDDNSARPGKKSYDITNRRIYDSTGPTPSVDGNLRKLVGPTGAAVIGWDNYGGGGDARLVDSDGMATLIDTTNHGYYDKTSGGTFFLWGGRISSVAATMAGKTIDVRNGIIGTWATVMIDWIGGILYDAFIGGAGHGRMSLDWINRILYDASEVKSIDYTGRVAYDSTSKKSVDYQNRVLADITEVTAIDYQNRTMNNAAGHTVAQWGPATTFQAVYGFTVGANDGISDTRYVKDGSGVTQTVTISGGIITGWTV